MELQRFTLQGPAGRLVGWSTGPIEPDRPSVLFVHPINMRGLIWADVVERMSIRRTCVLPDMRAHGESDPTGEFGLDEWLADLGAVVADQGLGSYHVVGGSLGGPLACCAAAAEPDRVVSVIAIGSSLRIDGVDVAAVLQTFDELGVAGTFRKVFPEITFGPGCPDEVIERGLELANPNDTATVKRVWLAAISSDVSEQAAAVRCPAMVITGEFDGTCTPPAGLELARALRAEQTLIPDIGHMPMLECPDRVAALIEGHMERAERRILESSPASPPAGGLT